MATLPLEHRRGPEELVASDTLKADDLGLFTVYGGKWLGDPIFDPVLGLNRRRAVVYANVLLQNLVPGVGDGRLNGAPIPRARSR